MAVSEEVVASAADIRWQSHDAWGQRREQHWAGASLGTDYIPEDSARGYTDHEHLDNVGLIHMNGRVYDPVLGRFLSPDPLVQAPHNTQSYNRYAYVFNNPLSFVDPSGYQTVCFTSRSEIVASPATGTSVTPGVKMCTEAKDRSSGFERFLQKSLFYVGILFSGEAFCSTPNCGNGVVHEESSAAGGLLAEDQSDEGEGAAGLGEGESDEKKTKKLRDSLNSSGASITGGPGDGGDEPDNDGDEDRYENPGHHDPSGRGPNAANSSKSALPRNHQELWNKSIRTNNKTRWAKEGTGKNAVYHRFQNDGRGGPFHWNGSTASGARSIPKHQVPNKIIKL